MAVVGQKLTFAERPVLADTEGGERARDLWTFYSPATSQSRGASASGTGPARTVVACAVAIAPARRAIRSTEQHQEERSVRLVFGCGPVSFRALHNDLPFSRGHAPLPYTTALSQVRFKTGN
jgi:hypothetical protein